MQTQGVQAMNTRLPKKFCPRKLSLALLSAGVIGTAGLSSFYLQDAQAAADAAVTATAPLGAAAVPNFAAITERSGPAVVNISVVGTSKAGMRGQWPGMPDDDPFWDFFRRF